MPCVCAQLTHGIKSEVDSHHRVLDNLVRIIAYNHLANSLNLLSLTCNGC